MYTNFFFKEFPTVTFTIRSNSGDAGILVLCIWLLGIITGNTALFDVSTINKKINFCHASIEHEEVHIVIGVFAVTGKNYLSSLFFKAKEA